MTRKHFKAIAETIAAMSDREAAFAMAIAFSKVAQNMNPRFNFGKFYIACGFTA